MKSNQNVPFSSSFNPDGNPATAGDVHQTKYAFDDRGQVALQFEQTGAGSLDAGDRSNRYLWGPTVDQLFPEVKIPCQSSTAERLSRP